MTSSDVTVGGGTPTVDFAYGQGVWMWDRSGRRFLDCTSQSWALYLGHANQEIAQHASEVMTRHWHVHQGFATDAREQFADELLNLVPNNESRAHYRQVAFSATSALAIETAVKLAALNHPGRHLVGRLQGGFHGTTLGTAQLSWPATDDVGLDRRSLRHFEQFGVATATLRFPAESNHYSNLVDEAIDSLNRELDEVADELVAVVVEPLQGSGGQRVVPNWWLRALVKRADSSGFSVIFDEIQTYLRCGRYYTHPESLRPHFIVLGKGLCGGFAAGAVLLRSDLQGFPRAGTYDLHTFATSALSHSVGLKLLEIVDRDHVLANVAQRGEQIRSAVERWNERAGAFDDIRQTGLHIGLRARGGPTAAARIRQSCLEQGLIVGLGGYDSSIVKVKPPLNITRGEVEELLDRLYCAASGIDA